jgi:hypothetical protein
MYQNLFLCSKFWRDLLVLELSPAPRAVPRLEQRLRRALIAWEGSLAGVDHAPHE